MISQIKKGLNNKVARLSLHQAHLVYIAMIIAETKSRVVLLTAACNSDIVARFT